MLAYLLNILIGFLTYLFNLQWIFRLKIVLFYPFTTQRKRVYHIVSMSKRNRLWLAPGIFKATDLIGDIFDYAHFAEAFLYNVQTLGHLSCEQYGLSKLEFLDCELV